MKELDDKQSERVVKAIKNGTLKSEDIENHDVVVLVHGEVEVAVVSVVGGGGGKGRGAPVIISGGLPGPT